MSENSAKLRATVDTNLFVSGTILKQANAFALLEAWRAAAFVVILDHRQYAELGDVFSRPRVVQRYRLTPREITQLFEEPAAAQRVEPSATIPDPLRDPKDAKILAAAIGGDADYLVTGDHDLLEHQGDPRLGQLQIVTVVEFLAILDELDTKGSNEA